MWLKKDTDILLGKGKLDGINGRFYSNSGLGEIVDNDKIVFSWKNLKSAFDTLEAGDSSWNFVFWKPELLAKGEDGGDILLVMWTN